MFGMKKKFEQVYNLMNVSLDKGILITEITSQWFTNWHTCNLLQ